MKKFAKKGKGQYGLALWAKFVGRYYLYQVIIIDSNMTCCFGFVNKRV